MEERMTFPGVNRQLDLKGIHKHGGSGAAFQACDSNEEKLNQGSADNTGAATRRFPAKEQHRAQRFAIQTMLRYRKLGEVEWQQGAMVNISESGVLFHTDHAAWPNSRVEIRFSLGLGNPEGWVAQAVCHGVIVRAISKPESTRVTALAARITKFHFVRSRPGPMA